MANGQDIFDKVKPNPGATPKGDVFDQIAPAGQTPNANKMAGAYQQAPGGPIRNINTDPKMVDAQGNWTGPQRGYLMQRPEESVSQFRARALSQAPSITPQAIQQEQQWSGQAAPAVLAAADIPGMAAGPLTKLIPSTERAGANFAAVAKTVGGHTIDVGKVGDVALHTKTLAESGGRMPKVINDFLRRATDPTKGPITYSEGRDFYTNATKLSSEEFMKLNPIMRRQAAEFTRELGSALEDTAGRAGKAEQLRQAMSEYSRAKTAASAAKTVGGVAAKVALGYGGWELLKGILKNAVP